MIDWDEPIEDVLKAVRKSKTINFLQTTDL